MPRARGRDWIGLAAVTSAASAVAAGPDNEAGYTLNLAFASEEAEGVSAFLRDCAEARQLLLELLEDPKQLKVTFDCYRLRGLVALLLRDDGTVGGWSEEALPGFPSMFDLQLVGEYEGASGRPSALEFLTAAAQQGWAPAYQKDKVAPATALLAATWGLQKRRG
jgi:hypothetical protein